MKVIESAIEAELTPVKLNVVSTDALSEDDVYYFIEKIYRYPIVVRFIEYMPIGNCDVKPGFSIARIKSIISKAGYGNLEPAAKITGNWACKILRITPSTWNVWIYYAND